MSTKHTPGSGRDLLVPNAFYRDHIDRCPSDNGDAGTVRFVRMHGKSRVWVRGTREQIECLRSDALFYAQGNVDDCAALVRSAKATLAAIAKATGEQA